MRPGIPYENSSERPMFHQSRNAIVTLRSGEILSGVMTLLESGPDARPPVFCWMLDTGTMRYTWTRRGHWFANPINSLRDVVDFKG